MTEMEKMVGDTMYKPTEIRPTILRGKTGYTITFPGEMFPNSNSHVIVDERGKRYTLIGPVMLSFHDNVPDWYLNTLTFWVEGDVPGTEFKVLVDEQ